MDPKIRVHPPAGVFHSLSHPLFVSHFLGISLAHFFLLYCACFFSPSSIAKLPSRMILTIVFISHIPGGGLLT